VRSQKNLRSAPSFVLCRADVQIWSEQVSKNRFHNELKLSSPDEIDAELLAWLNDAYALG